MNGLRNIHDRFLVQMDRLRGHWHRRDDIREDVSEGLKEVPGRWSESDMGGKLTILIAVALCGIGIVLTLG